MLRRNVKGDPAWAWAANSTTTEAFDSAYTLVEDQADLFTKQWHTHEVADVKKMYSLDELGKLCASYSARMDRPLTMLAKETQKLTKMHLIKQMIEIWRWSALRLAALREFGKLMLRCRNKYLKNI